MVYFIHAVDLILISSALSQPYGIRFEGAAALHTRVLFHLHAHFRKVVDTVATSPHSA